MRMGQGVRTGLGHGGITCVLQTQFSSLCLCDDSQGGGALRFISVYLSVHPFVTLYGIEYV